MGLADLCARGDDSAEGSWRASVSRSGQIHPDATGERIRQAMSVCSSPMIDVSDIKVTPEMPDDRRWAADLTSYLDERERRAIVQALRESQGDRSAAARLLGIAESALQKRLQYYHL